MARGVLLAHERIENVREPVQVGQLTVGCGPGCSPSRLIQTLGRPSSFAGAMSWKRLAATWTCRPARRPCAPRTRASDRGPACRSRSPRRRRSPRRERRAAPSRRRCSRGRCSRGSRASTRAGAPPRATSRTSGNGCQPGSESASASSSPARRAQPAHRLRHHLAVGKRAVGLELGLELVVAAELLAGPVLAEDTGELCADPAVPVDQRAVAVERRPARHSAKRLITIVAL